jgi:hypothetical protein
MWWKQITSSIKECPALVVPHHEGWAAGQARNTHPPSTHLQHPPTKHTHLQQPQNHPPTHPPVEEIKGDIKLSFSIHSPCVPVQVSKLRRAVIPVGAPWVAQAHNLVVRDLTKLKHLQGGQVISDQ